MTSRPLRLVAALALSASLVAACGSDDGDSATQAETRTFTADNGDIEIPVKPERIVATGYAVPVLIEADAPLVGISEWQRGLPMMSEEDLATYEELDKVAGDTNAASTNYEAIDKVDPDLIVIGVPEPALVDLDMDRLESIAPVVVIGPSQPSDWRENSGLQADAAGMADVAEQIKADYEARAAELSDEFAAVADLKFAHLGAYGEADAGTFQREFDGSWGTNIINDLGISFYGEVAEPGPGSAAVSEYPSIEELVSAYGEADVITYSVGDDGEISASVQYVLDSPLWQQLPAVKADRVFAVEGTEAATFTQALGTLNAIAEVLRPLLDQQ